MLYRDCLILMGVGGLFIIIGLAIIIWGKREEKGYYNALAKRPGDARELMEHWPPRQQPGALKAGGWIAIAIGVVMLVTGGLFCLLG
ncbi:MAG TPA: hypothetical protein VMW37_02450 [Dehalococcoidales bacterium]|nr:hypothetical protein [Dehalococcoidales bacterium]